MKLTEMMVLFVDSRKQGTGGAKKKCSDKTLEVYKRNIKGFVDFLAVGMDTSVLDYSDLKRPHLAKFLNHVDSLQKDGKWSKSTYLQMVRSLKTFFRWVDMDEDCQSAAHHGLQKYLPALETPPRRTEIPSTKDLKVFKNGFNTSNRWGHRDYVATCLKLDTGIRLGEICNLRVDHVLLAELVIIVTGKTGPRPVPITEAMGLLLKGWMKRRTQCKSAETSPFVFVSKYRDRMTVNGFGQRYRKHRAKLGLGKITAHVLRHSFCTNYLQKGGDMERLRLITGHSNYEMLRSYLHLAKIGGKSAHAETEKVSLLKDL